MKKLLAFIFAGLVSVFGLAHATVIMTDGSLEVYDPNVIYVPSGTLGPDIFSIGWVYTDPTYSNTVTLHAPSDLIGNLEYAITSGPDATGLFYLAEALSAGDDATVSMGLFPLASLSNPFTQWFSMAAFSMPTSIAFGQTVEDSLLAFPDNGLGGGDTGNGGYTGNGGGTGDGGGGSSPVPEPATLALLVGGLLGLGFTRRQQKATV